MLDRKIILPYKDDEGALRGESVMATKEGDHYRITSIPLYGSKIALYDLLDTNEREGLLYFRKIIEGSGRSVIQMTVFDEKHFYSILKDLEQFSCLWRRGDDRHLIAFDIPKLVAYRPIKDWLDQGERKEHWGYREACLSHE